MNKFNKIFMRYKFKCKMKKIYMFKNLTKNNNNLIYRKYNKNKKLKN